MGPWSLQVLEGPATGLEGSGRCLVGIDEVFVSKSWRPLEASCRLGNLEANVLARRSPEFWRGGGGGIQAAMFDRQLSHGVHHLLNMPVNLPPTQPRRGRCWENKGMLLTILCARLS